jgi:uncharacterized LabA/DUF88 family protein
LNQEIYQKICTSLDESLLRWLFSRVFERQQLARLARESGMTSVDGASERGHDDLSLQANWLVGLFRWDCIQAEKICLSLEKKYAQEFARVRALDPEALREQVGNCLLKEGRIGDGRTIWAMLWDERDEVFELGREVLIRWGETESIADANDAGDCSDGEVELEEPAHPGDVEELQREIVRLRRRERRALEKAEKAKEQLVQSKAGVGQIRKERTELHDELEKAQRTIEELTARLTASRGQEAEIQRLEEQLACLQAEKADLLKEIGRILERQHDIPVLRERIEYLEEENTALRSNLINALEDVMHEREQLVNKLERTRKEVVASLRRVENEKKLHIDRSLQTRGLHEPRVGLFVDVQNMFYAARKRFNGKLNYQELISFTLRGRKMAKAVAYIIQTPDVDQTQFIALLERCGYKVRSKELKTRLDGSAKGDWDMDIAMDIISSIQQLDVVILVSGDGDFVPLVKMLKKHGLRVEVVSFEYNTAMELREEADLFLPVVEDLILD